MRVPSGFRAACSRRRRCEKVLKTCIKVKSVVTRRDGKIAASKEKACAIGGGDELSIFVLI